MKTLINFFKRRRTNQDSSIGSENNKSLNQYFCPMKCEENKVYDSPGKCPVCNMKLISSNDIKASFAHFHCNI